ncbi:MAG: O-antigen ligase family protein, partial [Cellvibrionaceae bacterium]|nr:O-antigen ligase family protein [Cellvibrionaceae bacterium]
MTTRPHDSHQFAALMALLVWLPLPLASNRPWSQALLVIWLSVQLGLWLWGYIRGRYSPSYCLLKAWWLHGLLGAHCAWQLGQLLWLPRVDWHSQVHTLCLSLALWTMFCLSLQLLSSGRRLRIAAGVLVGSALLQALFGSFMSLSGAEYLLFVPKDSYLGVATGTFVNRNSYAAYLTLCGSVGIGLMVSTLAAKPAGNWREHGRRLLQTLLSRKIVLRLSLVMIVAGLVMSHSRMGNSSFFISLMVLGPLGLILLRFNKKLGQRGSWRGMVLLLASLVIIDIAVVGTFFGVDKVAQRLQATSQASETRDDLLREAYPLLQQTYIEGAGGGTFYTLFPQYRQYETGARFYDLAHNDYLQFVLEFGLAGTLPLAALVLAVFVLGLRSQLSRGSSLLRGLGFGASMGCMAMAI